MKIEDIQQYLVDRLSSFPALDGVPVLPEDGTFPKTPSREESLRSKGLLLIVWQIEPGGVIDTSATGAAVVEVYVPVIVEENVRVNRSDSGTGIVAERAMRHVISAVTGNPNPREGSGRTFVLMDPWFRNMGCQGGVQRFIINLVIPVTLIPGQ